MYLLRQSSSSNVLLDNNVAKYNKRTPRGRSESLAAVRNKYGRSRNGSPLPEEPTTRNTLQAIPTTRTKQRNKTKNQERLKALKRKKSKVQEQEQSKMAPSLTRGSSFKIKLTKETLPVLNTSKVRGGRAARDTTPSTSGTPAYTPSETTSKLHRLPSILQRSVMKKKKRGRGRNRSNSIHVDEFISSEKKIQEKNRAQQKMRLAQHFNRLGIHNYDVMEDTPTEYTTLPMFDNGGLSARRSESATSSIQDETELLTARSNRSERAAHISLSAASTTTEVAPFLIYNHQSKKFKISEVARSYFVEKMKDPFVVASFIGSTDEGNHSLLNVLTNSQEEGFKNGSRGITYAVMKDTEKAENHVRAPDLVVFNVERFTNFNGNYGYEAKLFLINLLLSSVFCFNSDTLVNDDLLERFHYLSQMYRFMKPGGFNFPKLFWLVRRSMKDTNQAALTEAFENELSIINAATSKTKFALKKVFPDRRVVMVPKIVNDYDTFTTNSIEYLEGVSLLKDEIASFEHLKTIMTRAYDEIKLTGTVFMKFCQFIVDAVNKAKSFEPSGDFQNIIRDHCFGAMRRHIAEYESTIEDLQHSGGFPMDPYEFQSWNQRLVSKLSAKLSRKVRSSGRLTSEVIQDFESVVNAVFYKYVRENDAKCLAHSTLVAHDLYAPIHAKLENYRSIDRFNREVEDIKNKFWHESVGLIKQKVWMELRAAKIDPDLLLLQKKFGVFPKSRYSKPRIHRKLSKQLSLASISGISVTTAGSTNNMSPLTSGTPVVTPLSKYSAMNSSVKFPVIN